MLRGYVDRLDVAPDGAMRVVDYKTGRSPSELFEAKALFQMKFYALVLWRHARRDPAPCSSWSTSATARSCATRPTSTTCSAIERNLKAIWDRHRARRADRRLAAQHLAAVRLVRLPRPLPRLGRHPSAAARGRRADRPRPGRAQARSTPPTSERRAAASSASRPGSHAGPARRRCTAPAISGTGTTCGTASGRHPGGDGRAHPRGRVLDGHAVLRRHAEQPGRGQVGLRVRLAVRDLVAGHHRGEGPLGQGADDGVGQRPPRHGHQRAGHPVARAARRAARGRRAATARARAPGRPPARAARRRSARATSVIGEWSRMNCGRHHQVVADELVGELVAPRAAVLGDDRVLRGDPVGLGVDEGAVHVPEDRCGEAHGSTSLVSRRVVS